MTDEQERHYALLRDVHQRVSRLGLDVAALRVTTEAQERRLGSLEKLRTAALIALLGTPLGGFFASYAGAGHQVQDAPPPAPIIVTVPAPPEPEKEEPDGSPEAH